MVLAPERIGSIPDKSITKNPSLNQSITSTPILIQCNKFFLTNLLDASSYNQSDSIRGEDKQKGLIEFDKDQASSNKGKHSMQAKLHWHPISEDNLVSSKWQ